MSLHFLCDILSTLGQLNKTFQIPTYHSCDAHRKVTEVIKALKNRYLQKDIRWGPYTTECIEEIAHHTIQLEETELQKQMEEKKRLETDVTYGESDLLLLTSQYSSFVNHICAHWSGIL